MQSSTFSAETIIERIDKLLSISQRWLTVREACLYSKMCRNTLMHFIDSGEIKASKKQGKWIVDRLSIDAFYEDRETEILLKDIAGRIGL